MNTRDFSVVGGMFREHIGADVFYVHTARRGADEQPCQQPVVSVDNDVRNAQDNKKERFRYMKGSKMLSVLGIALAVLGSYRWRSVVYTKSAIAVDICLWFV